MMKQAIKLNDSIKLCHRQITNSGREIVGLKIVDVETGAWDLFDFDRGQVSQMVEWLSDWLEQSATTCDLTDSMHFRNFSTSQSSFSSVVAFDGLGGILTSQVTKEY